MEKSKLANGLVYYKATAAETALLGGYGICDECSAPAPEGYLVPVLNHYQCEECFKSWAARAKNYPEDRGFELRRMTYFEAMIPMTGGASP